MNIVENFNIIKEGLPPGLTLVAVSKTKPISMIQDLYRVGHLDFGENKVQDLLSKQEALPDDIRWHMIGHLQSNKVKYIAPFVSLIHAVDSLKLLQIIDKEAEKNDRIIDCLIQVRIAVEDTKFGISEDDLNTLLSSESYSGLKNVRVCGLMGMATYTDDSEQVRAEFRNLKCIFEKLKESFFKDSESFSILSMGMSADYKLAIEEGSNMIRVGSSIFGLRNYI